MIPIQVHLRQKEQEAPVIQGLSWKKLRKYVKRKVKLKQWQWKFEEQIAGRSWCERVPNPFTVSADRRYRIALKGKRIRPHPGQGSSAALRMTK
jgi:hypothetical protein